MMKLGLRQILLSFVFYLLLLYPGYSQNSLNLLPIGQKKSNWCWAASMEMVMSYHNNTKGQCVLAHELQVLQVLGYGPGTSGTPGICCYNNCDPDPLDYSNLNCNSTIPFSKRDGDLNIQYTDKLFARNKYHSVESVHTEIMDYDAVKKEILACRPFLIFINKLDTSIKDIPYYHTVVGKGNTEFLNDQFVLVNDPQKPKKVLSTPSPPTCEGCEVLLPIEIFSADVREFNSALEVVRFIRPIDQDVCKDCSSKETLHPAELLTAISDNASIISVIPSTQMDVTVFSDLLAAEVEGQKIFEAPNTFSPQGVSTYGNFMNITLVVTRQTTPALAFYFEEINNQQVLKSITTEDCSPYVEGIQASLVSAESEVQYFSAEDIQIIEFVQGDLVFYRVQFKDSSYLIPTQNYFELKKGIMYREKLVVRKLRKYLRKSTRKPKESDLKRIQEEILMKGK